jgi:miniconductance mechanosensitive channel
MLELWKSVAAGAAAGGLNETLASVAASVVCSAGVVGAAFACCLGLGAAARRAMTRAGDGARFRSDVHLLVRRGARFLFAWILSAWLPSALRLPQEAGALLSRLLDGIAVLLCASMLSGAISYFRSLANARSWAEKAFASKTLVQTVKILLWFTAAIVVASTLMGKSPAFVLSGLGALTAVLMLIFRDSLLGLVAGIQVSQNDMVRLGDWITMPKHNADGTVIDIALTTVKVRNFDNTVTMIPSSALISDAFINWRYMSTSKGRRIKRPVWISVTSVRELTPEEQSSLVSQGLLKAEDRPVSNLAAFELWMSRMLKSNDNITQELTCMVRQTEAEDTGIPVEVYAFTKTRDWVEYEQIQTGIFDRIFVTVPKFGLQIYQRTGDKFLVPQA